MTKKPEIWAVVPAAGSGNRMESEIPKQYLKINGVPLLAMSIRKLLALDEISGVVVALREGDENWSDIDLTNLPNVHTVVGGSSRSQSVLSALHYLSHLDGYEKEDIDLWVCVHDAARPCVQIDSIKKLIHHCLENQRGAILGVPIADTIKQQAKSSGDEVEKDQGTARGTHIEKTVNRENLWQAHTPQMFLLRELKPALDYCELDGSVVTDEASAIENVHGDADLVLDRRDNIKVTLPEDLALAEFILRQQAKAVD